MNPLRVLEKVLEVAEVVRFLRRANVLGAMVDAARDAGAQAITDQMARDEQRQRDQALGIPDISAEVDRIVRPAYQEQREGGQTFGPGERWAIALTADRARRDAVMSALERNVVDDPALRIEIKGPTP